MSTGTKQGAGQYLGQRSRSDAGAGSMHSQNTSQPIVDYLNIGEWKSMHGGGSSGGGAGGP